MTSPSFRTRLSVWAPLTLLAPALGAPACEPSDTGPRQSFATMTTCPASESTVVPRPDYRMPLPPAMSPPADVAADPSRLADWQRRDAAARRLNEGTACGAALPGFEAFEITGCGKDVLLCCGRAPPPGGPAPYGNDSSCVQMPLAGGGPPLRRGTPGVPPPPASAPPPVEPPASSAGIAL
jgi:hypothetical protein